MAHDSSPSEFVGHQGVGAAVDGRASRGVQSL